MLKFIEIDHPLYEQELDLRFRILREPLGHGREDVAFPYEGKSLHLVAVSDERVVGCVLFHPEDESEGRLFQMAVEPELQGSGMGRRLVVHLEDHLRSEGFRRITLHARDRAIGFYEKLGYACYGDPFTEVGIPHAHMAQNLSPNPETHP